MEDIKVGNLRTLLVCASRTVDDRKTHTIICDGAEDHITKGFGLERHAHQTDELGALEILSRDELSY